MRRLTFFIALVIPSLVSAIETPKYLVLETLSASVEVRQYSEFTLARVHAKDLEKNSDNRFFRALADYIFGANSRGEKISMTAPVAQTMEDGKPVDMAFFLPKDLEVPPEPENINVQLVRGDMTVAVIGYKGGWSIRKFENAKRNLEEELRKQGAWQIVGDPIWARYNSPFSIPALRRNEVFIPVARP